jgi:hypothetical protein
MAGGMGRPSRGVPLGQRPTVVGTQPVGAHLPRRHVWVIGPDGDGPHPGLILQWERRGQDWWAWCVWVVVDAGVAVQQWLPSKLIRPV